MGSEMCIRDSILVIRIFHSYAIIFIRARAITTVIVVVSAIHRPNVGWARGALRAVRLLATGRSPSVGRVLSASRSAGIGGVPSVRRGIWVRGSLAARRVAWSIRSLAARGAPWVRRRHNTAVAWFVVVVVAAVIVIVVVVVVGVARLGGLGGRRVVGRGAAHTGESARISGVVVVYMVVPARSNFVVLSLLSVLSVLSVGAVPVSSLVVPLRYFVLSEKSSVGRGRVDQSERCDDERHDFVLHYYFGEGLNLFKFRETVQI